MKFVTSNELKDVRTEGGGFSLLDLMDEWARRLAVIAEQLEWRDERYESWGIDDYIGTLTVRDSIKKTIERACGRDLPNPVIHVIDKFFESFTEEEHEFDIRSDPGSPDDAWWWHRIPRTGLIRAEYRAAVERET